MLIFLVYPALTTTIMRTFVCKEYAQDDKGNPTRWLVDDTVVQCDLTQEGGTYAFLFAYSWFMVVVIVIGFPLYLYYRLWTWRHPFDRMYFIDEDGHEKPTPEALENLDTIVMFRSGAWAMAIFDMFFKFTIVS